MNTLKRLKLAHFYRNLNSFLFYPNKNFTICYQIPLKGFFWNFTGQENTMKE